MASFDSNVGNEDSGTSMVSFLIALSLVNASDLISSISSLGLFSFFFNS
jgi:hypothetical protein